MADSLDMRRSAEALIRAVHINDAQAITALWNLLNEQERLELAIGTAAAALEHLRAALPEYDDEQIADYLAFSAAILAQTPTAGNTP